MDRGCLLHQKLRIKLLTRGTLEIGVGKLLTRHPLLLSFFRLFVLPTVVALEQPVTFSVTGGGEYLPFMPTSIHIRPNEMTLAVKRRAAVVCAENRRPNKNRISVRESVGTDQS
jgi:hypothetical protein